MRRQNKIKAFKKSGSSSEFPTITLSAAENDSDEDDDDDGYVQKDSFIEVGQVVSEITGLDTGGDATENDTKEKETEPENRSSKSSSHHGRSGRHRRN